MNRRQLVFILFVNALLSLVVALAVVWAVEQRRPDLEALSAFAMLTPAAPQAISTVVPVANIGEDDTPPSIQIAATQPPDTQPATPEPAQPTTPPTTPTPLPENLEIYIVQGGDSLSAIATRFKISLQRLMEINQLVNPDFVFSGQRLLVPPLEDEPAPAVIQPEVAESILPSGVQIRSVENPGNLEDEAVFLVNESNQPVNLDGWTLSRAGGPAYTFENLPLFAGSGVRVYSKSGTNSTIALHWGMAESLWSTGVIVTLGDSNGQDVFQYVVP